MKNQLRAIIKNNSLQTTLEELQTHLTHNQIQEILKEDPQLEDLFITQTQTEIQTTPYFKEGSI